MRRNHLIQDYQRNHQGIIMANIRTFYVASIIGMIAFALLTVISLPPLGLLQLVPAYISFFFLSVATFLTTKFLLHNNEKLTLIVSYIIIIALYTVAILMGTILHRGINAVTFIVLIVALPSFIIDLPYRLSAVSIIATIIFMIVSYKTKTYDLYRIDIINSALFCILGIISNVSTYNNLNKEFDLRNQLSLDANVDALTNLNNRRFFQKAVEEFINRNKNESIMILLDIDNFKTVNDTYGHGYGDKVLEEIAIVLSGSFRYLDIISRFGGDEFIIFLPGLNDLGVVLDKLQVINKHIEKINHNDIPVSLSSGIVLYPGDGGNFDELYKNADTALYQAKKLGKSQAVVYDKESV